MFIVRPVAERDLDFLLALAHTVNFINLPPDREALRERIGQSLTSFAGEARSLASGMYMFVVEEKPSGRVAGTSQIVAQMGSPAFPNTWMRIEKRWHATEALAGGRHFEAEFEFLVFGWDTDGPTEVGGLIVPVEYRSHPARLGRMLSLVRFHYIARHRDRFKNDLLAEMMGVLTPGRSNLFWEAFPGRFIPLTYDEADRLSTRSKRFIIDLLPKEPVPLVLLPEEARAIIGEVGRDTVPARKMLERLGFEYRQQIDPFDAGPHLQASVDDLRIVRETGPAHLQEVRPLRDDEPKATLLVSRERPGEGTTFRATIAEARRIDDPAGDADPGIVVPPEIAAGLEIETGDALAITPV